MAGSSSSWSAPTFGSAMGSSSSWSAPDFGRGMSSSLPSSWSASGFGRPMGLFSSSPAHSIWGSPAPSSSMSFECPYSWTAPAFGVSSTEPSPFGSSGWVSEKGSRVSAYTLTAADDSPNLYLQSISAMPVYKSKSHEELRHEDYQRGDKGVSEKGSRVSAYTLTAADDSHNLYLQSISAIPVYNSKSHEELRHEDYQRGDKGGDSLQKSLFTSAPVLPMHASSSVAAPADLNSSGPPSFSLKPQTHFIVPFPAAIEQPSAELQSSTQVLNCTSNPFWLSSTGPQSSFLSAKLSSTQVHNCPISLPAPCTAHRGTLFGTAAQTASATTSSTQATTASFGPSSFPAATQRGGNLFNPHYSSSFYAPCTACRENASNNSAAYTASADTSSTQNMFSQNLFPTISTQSGGSLFSPSVAHSAPAPAPYVHCTSINVDYPKNTIDLLLPIDIRLVRIRFSSTNDGTGSIASQFPSVGHHDAKASARSISFSIYPGANQELAIKSMEQSAKSQTWKQCNSTVGSCPNDKSGCREVSNSAACPPSSGPAENQENSSDVHHTHRSPLAAPECKVITESVLPRLYNADYYTIPSIVELAVRESDEPGYCSHVKDFMVGRRGYGSVKFDGETDVRKLDIASIVEFNDREILVYKDESKTPPFGQELNKPAEVTLLNLKCIDQKTGLQFTEGPTVDRYKDILVQWTKEHDAEFVSFDAVKGEWKFRVKHFNQ